mgnify:CR=1 FL=1
MRSNFVFRSAKSLTTNACLSMPWDKFANALFVTFALYFNVFSQSLLRPYLNYHVWVWFSSDDRQKLCQNWITATKLCQVANWNHQLLRQLLRSPGCSESSCKKLNIKFRQTTRSLCLPKNPFVRWGSDY